MPVGEVTPALTMVNNPITEIAFQATDLLVNIIEGKTETIVNNFMDTSLAIRETTAVCPE